jgi:lipoprotein-anchoring transpeptidase ErfK/SrfK
MYLDNETTTNIVQSDNRRLYRDDGVYPVKRPTAGGGGVDVVWRNTILIATNDTANIAAAIHDYTVEDGLTFDEMFRVQHSALTGKVTGAGTTTERFRDIADTKDRIIYTVDANGNRTAVVQDGTA